MVKQAKILHLPDGVLMSFQRIPPKGDAKPFRLGERGLSWIVGSSEPVINTRLAQPFYLGTFPITQAQFGVWTQAEGIEHKNEFDGHPDHPAEKLDWRQAMTYCEWLTRVASPQMPPGHIACLPTETEWEYACRAGTDTEYYTGDGEAALREAGWFGENYDNGATHPVGRKAANAFGLFDMHGNVWEWCHDAWEPEAHRDRVDGDDDPWHEQRLNDWKLGLEHLMKSDRVRVLRGGSWNITAWYCRSAVRNLIRPDNRFRNIGFRVCLVPGSSTLNCGDSSALSTRRLADGDQAGPVATSRHPDTPETSLRSPKSGAASTLAQTPLLREAWPEIF